jgi:hypothetical protein
MRLAMTPSALSDDAPRSDELKPGGGAGDA